MSIWDFAVIFALVVFFGFSIASVYGSPHPKPASRLNVLVVWFISLVLLPGTAMWTAEKWQPFKGDNTASIIWSILVAGLFAGLYLTRRYTTMHEVARRVIAGKQMYSSDVRSLVRGVLRFTDQYQVKRLGYSSAELKLQRQTPLHINFTSVEARNAFVRNVAIGNMPEVDQVASPGFGRSGLAQIVLTTSNHTLSTY